MTSVLHGHEHWKRVARKFSDTSLPGQLLHIGFELVILVLDRIEEQALRQVGAALGVVHLLDEMLDLLDHLLERAIARPLGGNLAVERFHDGEQIAVERDFGAGAGLDGSHRYAPKLLTALGSSA